MDDAISRFKALCGLGPNVGQPWGVRWGACGEPSRCDALPPPRELVAAPRPVAGEESGDSGSADAALLRDISYVVDWSGPRSQNSEGGSAAKSPTRRKRKRRSNDANSPVPPAAAEPKRALSINEAARLYSISRSSLYLLISRGQLPDIVVAGRRLIPRDAMEALIAGARS